MASKPKTPARVWMRPFAKRPEPAAPLILDLSKITGDAEGTAVIRFTAPTEEAMRFVVRNYNDFAVRYPALVEPGSVATYLLLAACYLPDTGEVLTESDRVSWFAIFALTQKEVLLYVRDRFDAAFGPPSKWQRLLLGR